MQYKNLLVETKEDSKKPVTKYTLLKYLKPKKP